MKTKIILIITIFLMLILNLTMRWMVMDAMTTIRQDRGNLEEVIRCYQIADIHLDEVELIYNPKTEIYTCEVK